MGRNFIIRKSYNEIPESPWHMLMGRISHGSSEQLQEAFLHQLVSNLPGSSNGDPQDTVWSHTFVEKKRRISASDGWEPALPNELSDGRRSYLDEGRVES